MIIRITDMRISIDPVPLLETFVRDVVQLEHPHHSVGTGCEQTHPSVADMQVRTEFYLTDINKSAWQLTSRQTVPIG